MSRYIMFKPSGEIITAGTMTADEIVPGMFIGYEAMLSDVGDPHTHYVNADGVVTEYSAGGRARKEVWHGDGFEWNPGAEDWVDLRSLDTAKSEAWAAIKARRDLAFLADATSATGIKYSIALDKANLADRISSLDAAIRVGLAPADTTINWRDRDNNSHALTLAQLHLLAAEMGGRGQAIFEHSWALDALVKAATTVADLGSLDMEAGWP